MNTLMLRLSLFLEPSSRKIRKRNQVLCYLSKTPTEVLLTYTPRASIPLLSGTSFFHRSTPSTPFLAKNQVLKKCLCSTLLLFRCSPREGHKKPRRRKWHIGTVGLRLGNASAFSCGAALAPR